MEAKPSSAWLSYQGETAGNALKWSHLSLRVRPRHTGGTGTGFFYLGEAEEIIYEYYLFSVFRPNESWQFQAIPEKQ